MDVICVSSVRIFINETYGETFARAILIKAIVTCALIAHLKGQLLKMRRVMIA